MKAGMIESTRSSTHRYVTHKTGLTDLHKWVFEAYGFLIGRNESISLRQFAERIKRYYSLDNGHNRATYEAMVQLAEAEGV